MIIGVIKNASKVIIGYRMMDTASKETKDIPVNSLKGGLRKGIKIDNICLSNNEIEGTKGALSRYPTIINGNLVGKSPLIVLKELDGGYEVADWKGKVGRYKTEDVVKYSKNNGIANGKVVEKDNKEFISAISGTYAKEEKVQNKEQEKKEEPKQDSRVVPKQDSKVVQPAQPSRRIKTQEKESKVIDSGDVKGGKELKSNDNNKTVTENGNTISNNNNPFRKPTVKINKPNYDGLDIKDKESDMTVEQKLVKAMLVIKGMKPFYYAIWAGLKKIPVEEEIVPTMAVSIDKLYYCPKYVAEKRIQVLIFVMMHECLHILMKHNIREKEGMNHRMFNYATDLIINKLLCDEFNIKMDGNVVMCQDDIYGIGIAAENGLYNSKIDVEKDTAEGVYAEIMQEFEKGKEELEKIIAQNKKMVSIGSTNLQPEEVDIYLRGEFLTKLCPDKDGSGNGSGEEGSNKSKGNGGEVFKDKNGNEQESNDLIEDEDEKGENAEQKEFKANSVIEKAVNRTKQSGEHIDAAVERIIELSLAPKISWKSLLKHKLIEASSKITTYAAPDRRFLGRDIILPGPKSITPDKLKGVKIGIDTSGSISETEIGLALSQLKLLLKTYKAEAELIYWDTAVRERTEFTDVKTMLSIKPKGGGGTDANCLFEYLDSKECKVKASIVIVFTDGCIPEVNKKYARKYKDTIWVINDQKLRLQFKQPFGKKADLK